jgi:hypothetical protein
MRALILIGSKRTKDKGLVPECLYCGLDGVELQTAADKAAASGEYAEIGRLIHPVAAPMPIDPTPTTITTPTFPRPKVLAQPKVKKAQAEEEAAAKRAKTNPAADISLDKNGSLNLRTDGPEFEEWIAKGYAPAGYPPKGYAAKESAAWTMFQAEREKSKTPVETGNKDEAPTNLTPASTPPPAPSTPPASTVPATAQPEAAAPAPESAPAPEAATQTPPLASPVEPPLDESNVPEPSAASTPGAETKTAAKKKTK